MIVYYFLKKFDKLINALRGGGAGLEMHCALSVQYLRSPPYPPCFDGGEPDPPPPALSALGLALRDDILW